MLDLPTPGEAEPGWGGSAGGSAMLSLSISMFLVAWSQPKKENKREREGLCLCARVKMVLSVHKRSKPRCADVKLARITKNRFSLKKTNKKTKCADVQVIMSIPLYW